MTRIYVVENWFVLISCFILLLLILLKLKVVYIGIYFFLLSPFIISFSLPLLYYTIMYSIALTATRSLSTSTSLWLNVTRPVIATSIKSQSLIRSFSISNVYLKEAIKEKKTVTKKKSSVKKSTSSKITSAAEKQAAKKALEAKKLAAKAKTLKKKEAANLKKQKKLAKLQEQKAKLAEIKRLKDEKEKERPKKPATGFIAYVRENYSKNRNGDENSRNVISRLAIAWKNESDEVRNKYINLNKDEMETYKLNYASWKAKYKRPLNAYVKFIKHSYENSKKPESKEESIQQMIQFASKWKSLTPEEKQSFASK